MSSPHTMLWCNNKEIVIYIIHIYNIHKIKYKGKLEEKTKKYSNTLEINVYNK